MEDFHALHMTVYQTAKLHWKRWNNKTAECFQPQTPPPQTMSYLLETHQQHSILQY